MTALSRAAGLQRDWAIKGTYDAVMDIVKTHFGAYGVGRRVRLHDGPRRAGDGVPRIRRSGPRARVAATAIASG